MALNLVILGAPGSGKGTYASRVAGRFGIPAVSTGEILRQAMQSGTELGREVRAFVEGGRLVPDPVMAAVLRERLGMADCGKGFILDGYPRTLEQAEELDRALRERGGCVSLAIAVEASEELIMGRLSGRRSCRLCGAIYNLNTMKPAREGKCDKCGGDLVVRPDDETGTIRKRLEVYRAASAPLIERYRASGVLRQVNSDAPVEEVVESIVGCVRQVTGS